jgi:hypothetical protein
MSECKYLQQCKITHSKVNNVALMLWKIKSLWLDLQKMWNYAIKLTLQY